jgi:hypothetical protein
MKYLLLSVVFLISQVDGFAQKKTPFVFNSYNSFGFVAGQSPLAVTVQTVNGIAFNKWFVGAGFGMDDYFERSLPVFIDVKRAFEFKKSHLFLYADAGSHLILKDNKKINPFSSFSTSGNLYIDAGMGIKIKTSRKSHLFFSIGNTLKNITETETSIDTGFPYKNETVYKLSRISFRMGYQF